MTQMMTFNEHKPIVDSGAWIMPGTSIIGRVRLASGVSIWPGAVLRGDIEEISIGENSNIQDNVSCHTSTNLPLIVGENVTVGHNAVLHGCIIGDGCLIGMGAVILDGVKLGNGCIVGAGAVISPGKVIPDGVMVVGVPGKPKRDLTEEEKTEIIVNAERYLKLAEEYRKNMER